MRIFENKDFARWFIIFSSLSIVILVSWNVALFYERIKKDERQKMAIWSEAQKSFNNASTKDVDLGLELYILSTDLEIPIINTDEQGTIFRYNNIPPKIEEDSLKLYQFLEELKSTNKPIKVDLGNDNYQYIYYGNSQILEKIKYYPIILLLIFALFTGLIFLFFRTSKFSEKNKLWAGMAKETAHQIGTPLSSLVGWIEILKTNPSVDQSYIDEMTKDVNRLQTITNRFSKIGSEVVLTKTDLIKETKSAVDYLRNKHSKLIEFDVQLDKQSIDVKLNTVLYSWTIENIIKNAVDAMKGKGKIKITSEVTKNWVSILISDQGKGIPKHRHKQIFEAGYTSKKRGWGLGLSLAKRIIENYHKGKIRVKQSDLNQGACFEIKLQML
jgi:signal transduction histidine kinase